MSSSSSSRRPRRRPSPPAPAPAPGAAAAPGEQQVADDELVSRLRALLPRDGKAKASSRARVLREACLYIRRLHAELDAAAERLARLLEDVDPSVAAAVGGVDGTDDDDAADDDELILRNLVM